MTDDLKPKPVFSACHVIATSRVPGDYHLMAAAVAGGPVQILGGARPTAYDLTPDAARRFSRILSALADFSEAG